MMFRVLNEINFPKPSRLLSSAREVKVRLLLPIGVAL